MWQQVLRLGLVLAGLSLASEARAQVVLFGPSGSSPMYSGYGYGPGMNYGMSGYFPGYYMPYYYGNSYSTFTVPGWGASGTNSSDGWYVAESRASRFPAVALPVSSPLLQVETPIGARAEVVVSVPTAQAQVWVEGALTKQQGKIRRFATPSLRIGKEYEYQIVAQWTDSQGQVQTARKTVTFQAGDEVQVAFPQ